MAAEMCGAGPEWAYCVRHLQANKAMKVEFNYMYINVRREGDEPKTIIDSLQALSKNKEGMYVPSSVVRFDFDELKNLIGPRFDISFRALEDIEHELAIPDDQSFRRLLVAIGRLGLPMPAEYDTETDPPVLWFSAKPTEPEPIKTASTIRGSDGRRLVRNAKPPTGRGPRALEPPGPAVRTPTTGGRTKIPGPQPSTPRARKRSYALEPLNEPDRERPQPTGQRTYAPQLRGGPVTPPPVSPGPVSPGPVSPPLPPSPPPKRKRTLSDEVVLQASPAPGDNRRHSRRPSLPSPAQLDAPAKAGESSFLEAPVAPEEELTLEERLNEPDLDYAFSAGNDIHDEKIHNLYADIAGISRDRRDPENESHKYKPPYANVSLPPHQSYPTAWILQDGARVLHYLADKPGLGKTYASCELMIRLTMILSVNIAIRNERAQLSEMNQRPLHVHEKESPRWGKNTECLADTVSKYGFVCPCQKTSPVYEIIRKREFVNGYMLVMVPLHTTGQWYDEIKAFIRSTTRLPHNLREIEVIDIHEDPDGAGDAFKRFIYEEREHHGLGTICIVPTTSTVKSALSSLYKESDKEMLQQPSIIVIDEMQDIKSVGHQSIRLVRRLIDFATYPVHVLCLSGSPMRYGPADFDVCESIALNKESFGGWHGKAKYAEYEGRLKKARQNLNEYAKQVTKAGIIGRGTVDDVPEEEQAESHALMKSYDQRCREYAAQVPLLQRNERSDYLGFRIPRKRPQSGPPEIVRCNSTMDEAQKEVANQYKAYLHYRYLHRVRVWSRKPLDTRGPRPKLSEMLFQLDSKQAPLHIKAPVTQASIGDTSLIMFAPGLTKSVLKRSKPGQFHAAEANDIFKGTTTQSQRQAAMRSQYWPQVNSAFQKEDENGEEVLHPKIEEICKIIDDMLVDQEVHDNLPPGSGFLPKKAIICVPHAWQGYILICYLFNRYKRRNFTFVGAGSTPAERQKLLAPFMRKTDVRDPADSRSHDPIAVIGTFRFIGNGLNLTRANYAIATSPLGSFGDQKQFFGRIDRLGQHCTAHTYVLADNGNPVDVCTFHRMQRRTVLTVPQDEMGEGLAFLLENIDVADEEEVDTEVQSGAEDSEAEVVGAAVQPGNEE